MVDASKLEALCLFAPPFVGRLNVQKHEREIDSVFLFIYKTIYKNICILQINYNLIYYLCHAKSRSIE